MNGVDTANRGDVNNYGAVRTNGHANGTVNGHANGSVNGHIVSMNGTENGDCQQLNGKSTSCNGSHPATKKMESLTNGAAKYSMTNGTSAKISDFDGFLFDPSILQNIPWSQESQSKFKGGISVHSPGEDLVIRPLHIDDYHKGFLSILAMLTSVGSVSEAQFLQRFEMMRKCPNSYYVTVIEDKKKGEVIGCATLQVEFKFIHEAGVRGRIEDVVVSDAYRGRQLGKLLLETLTILGREYVGCYKMSLECKDSLIKFYGQFGFNKDAGNNYLQQRFEH